MIIACINIRGLGRKAKTLSLHNLYDSMKHNIILLQETMGIFQSFIFNLKHLFPGWHFIGTNSACLSGGLITSLSPRISLINSYSIAIGLFTNIFILELNHQLKILNIYGPYVDKEAFWKKTLGLSQVLDENLILGGNINFIVNEYEIWGV
jgi:hypothetical protein